MTLEEALSKVSDADAKATLQKIINDQNKYIGQLEQLTKATKTDTPKDDITMKYLEKNMRRDVIEEATATIKTQVNEEVFKAVEPDFLAFLNKTMKKENTTAQFCIDAFSLVYGQCLMNKDHAVNKIGKDTNPQSVTPQASNTNGPSVAAVQSIIANQPPIITDKDQAIGSAQGLPNTATQTRNTRDAFKSLKERFGQVGNNRFQ